MFDEEDSELPYEWTFEVTLMDKFGFTIFPSRIYTAVNFGEAVVQALYAAREEGVNLSFLRMPITHYHGIKLDGFDFSRAKFVHTIFNDCELSNISFSLLDEDDSVNFELRNCELNNIIWPKWLETPEGDITVYKVVKISGLPPNLADKYYYDFYKELMILELRVPAEARRVACLGDPPRLRAEYAMPVEVTTPEGAPVPEELWHYLYPPQWGGAPYKINHMYIPDDFDDHFTVSCSHGVNCFLTRKEAVDYIPEID